VSPSRSPDRPAAPPSAGRTGVEARRLAIEALVRVERGAYSHILLPAVLERSGLGPRDRALVTRLTYGTLRHRAQLDAAVAACSHRSLRRLEAPVRAALRLGAYQLAAGLPAHAAVSATVTAAASLRPRSRAFVNAVLRRLAAEPPRIGTTDDLPPWLRDRLAADLGPSVAQVLGPPRAATATLRPNPRRTDTAALAERLAAAGVATEAGRLVPEALVVRSGPPAAWRRVVAEGLATPQDEASQAVVALLDPRPGERVLEVGAGPGGKSTAAAERMDDRGVVAACDRHPGRLRRVRDAAVRLGLGAIRPLAGDGRSLPAAAGAFDRVLVDAPCSGLGSWRRRPELVWRLRPDDPERLSLLQRSLVAEAARVLRPGGRLVYAVCTCTAVETLGVDTWLAEHHPELVAEPVAGPWRAHGRGGLLLAGDDHDGMYALVLRRDPHPDATRRGIPRRDDAPGNPAGGGAPVACAT
jgi:16S rRNA (cytosine967-C5)-methyltransferase